MPRSNGAAKRLWKLLRLAAVVLLTAVGARDVARGQEPRERRKVPLDVVRVWLVDFEGQPDEPPGNHEVVRDRLGAAPERIRNFDDLCGAGLSAVEWKDCRPHWPDKYTEKNWAVAYVRGSRVVIKEARFRVRSPAPLANVTVVGEANLGPGLSLRFEQGGVNQVADELIVSNVRADRDLPNSVSVFENLRIKWTVESAGVSLRASTSDHPVFVLFGAPTTTTYMTQLDFTTHAASGMTAEADVVAAVWSVYKTRAIDRRELKPKSGDIGHHGVRLSYWTPWSFLTRVAGQYRCPGVWTTEMILQQAVGRCGGWAVFMRDSLALHGITATDVGVDLLPGFPSGPAGAQIMLIKNWSFAGTPAGAGDFPYQTVIEQLVDATGRISGTYVGTPQFTDKPGLPGQSNDNPPGWFDVGDHAVVTYGGEVYDPSYGTGPFPDIVSWARASLEGYATITSAAPVPVPGGTQVRTTFEGHRGVP